MKLVGTMSYFVCEVCGFCLFGLFFFISVSCPEGKANITPYSKKQSTLDDVFLQTVLRVMLDW